VPLSAWTIAGAKPAKLLSTSVGLEKDLESWIAADPSLVDRGFIVLQQQLNLSAAGRLDLLCVDQQGRLAVVEIKRGTLIRETIAQGLDYASVVASWSGEMIRSQVGESVKAQHADHPGVELLLATDEDDDPREVEIVIVGCGADAAIDRMIEQQILVREEREPEVTTQQLSRICCSIILSMAEARRATAADGCLQSWRQASGTGCTRDRTSTPSC